MEFVSTQENFSRALSIVSRVAQKHISLPILENVLIQATQEGVKLIGTNLEIGIQHTFRAKVSQTGEVTVPAKVLMGFISNIPSENQIILTVENQDITLSSGRYTATIQGVDSQDYPILPKIENEDQDWLCISKNVFQTIISRAMVCVAPNDVRLEFSGVFARFSEKKVTLVSTDSFRLLEIENETLSGVGENQSVIIPLRTLSEVLHALSVVDTKDISFTFSGGQVFFRISDEVMVVSQLISGTFPDYTQIIPKDLETFVDVGTQDFLRAVKLASAFVQQKASEVIFRVGVDRKEVILESKGGVSGKNVTQLDAKNIYGNDQEVVFNPKYISDSLHLIDSEVVRIGLVNDSAPAIIGVGEGKNGFQKGFRYIIMPIKK